jgi:hypothetical protein
MTTPARAASRRRFLAGSLGALASSGCLPRHHAGPVVVTSWTPEELALIGLEPPLRLIRPPDACSPIELLKYGLEADILVGGSLADYRIHSASNHFLDLPAGPYQVARRASVALIASTDAPAPPPPGTLGWSALGAASWHGRFVIANPRHDPFTLAAVQSHLRAKPFGDAYADLVHAFGRARGIARTPRAALSSAARTNTHFLIGPDSMGAAFGLGVHRFSATAPVFDEGLAFPAGSRFAGIAGRLRDTLGATTIPPVSAPDALHLSLLAEFLGATLVTSHAELCHAIAALDAAEARRRPAARRAAAWLGEPPPWPPASVLLLRSRPGGRELLEQLASQVAPDASTQGAFLELMSPPAALISDETLARVAKAAEGRLAASSRFRAWLSAEWTAWAGQRYRRCARLARGTVERPSEAPHA